MMVFVGLLWGIVGFVFLFMGKDIMQVLGCFGIYAILNVAYELYLIRRELQDRNVEVMTKKIKESIEGKDNGEQDSEKL